MLNSQRASLTFSKNERAIFVSQYCTCADREPTVKKLHAFFLINEIFSHQYLIGTEKSLVLNKCFEPGTKLSRIICKYFFLTVLFFQAGSGHEQYQSMMLHNLPKKSIGYPLETKPNFLAKSRAAV